MKGKNRMPNNSLPDSTATLTAKAREILDDLLHKMDTDKRINRTYTKAQMIEIALRLLAVANVVNLDTPVGLVMGFILAEFTIDNDGE